MDAGAALSSHSENKFVKMGSISLPKAVSREVDVLNILYYNTTEHLANRRHSVFTLPVTYKVAFYAATVTSVHLALLSFSSHFILIKMFTFIVSMSLNVLNAVNPAF